MPGKPHNSPFLQPIPNPPVPDIQNLSSATEYTGLVPAALPFDAVENELRPFEENNLPLSGEPLSGTDSKKN